MLQSETFEKAFVRKIKEREALKPEEFLHLKDTLLLSDSKWDYLYKTLKLEGASVHTLRRVRTQQNSTSGVVRTTNGAKLDLLKIIKDRIAEVPSNGNKIVIKFAFDACRITSNIEEVIGTISQINLTKSDKSPANADQFIVWIGGETYEEYKAELGEVRDIINTIISDPIMEVKGQQITLDPYLVVDMKTLCVVLGLCEVYRSSSKYRCCWCLVTKDKLGDFSHDCWPMRCIKEMHELAKNKQRPGDNCGVKVGV